MVTVVFPAAGQGKRMKAGINKVFLELEGKSILVHTLLKFSGSARVDSLVVVVAPDEVFFIEDMLKAVVGLKPYKVVAGGSERQYSIANGLRAVPQEADIVLVHDAARPLVSIETIENVIDGAVEVGGAIAALPNKDVIRVVSEDGMVQETLPYEETWEVQTPQGFRKDILLEAYTRAEEEHFLGTDDSSLVERLGVPVKVVRGNESNIKVTTPEDLMIAESYLKNEYA